MLAITQSSEKRSDVPVLTAVPSGDGIRGGGCCANLPVFFSQSSGLVAVVARESASILPETMEDSLCSSLAAAPEVKQLLESNNVIYLFYLTFIYPGQLFENMTCHVG